MWRRFTDSGSDVKYLSLLSVSVTVKKFDCNFSVKIEVLTFKIKSSRHFFKFSKIYEFYFLIFMKSGFSIYGGLSPPLAQVGVKCLVKITRAMQLTHICKQFWHICTNSLFWNSSIRFYFVAVMRSPVGGNNRAGFMQRLDVRPSVCLSQHRPQQHTLLPSLRWPTSANVQKTHNNSFKLLCCGFSARWYLWATVRPPDTLQYCSPLKL